MWTLGCLSLLLAWATASDLRTRRIPNACSVGGAVLFVAVATPLAEPSPGGRLACALLLFGVLAALALLRPGSLGMGDAKLAGLIGAAVGPAAFAAILLATLGALAVLAPAALRAGPGGLRGTTVALAPHLALGTALVAGLGG